MSTFCPIQTPFNSLTGKSVFLGIFRVVNRDFITVSSIVFRQNPDFFEFLPYQQFGKYVVEVFTHPTKLSQSKEFLLAEVAKLTLLCSVTVKVHGFHAPVRI
jgi:hypothetical protein